MHRREPVHGARWRDSTARRALLCWKASPAIRVITLAQDEGLQVVEEPITRDQLYIADEVFLCGTAAEVVPVAEIDTRVIGEGGRGPITKKLQDLCSSRPPAVKANRLR